MKLQTAIDRVDLDKMLTLGASLNRYTDIAEVGTSLIKDYGIKASVGALRQKYPEMKILADIKTCDEGAYEFQRAYEAGADIATVMGFSANTTIQACAEVAEAFEKDFFIDLLELSEEAVRSICIAYPEAILGIHLSFDKQGEGLQDLVKRSTEIIRAAEAADGKPRRIAAAGGVSLDLIPVLRASGIDTVIVGSAITKSSDITRAASLFYQACHEI